MLLGVRLSRSICGDKVRYAFTRHGMGSPPELDPAYMRANVSEIHHFKVQVYQESSSVAPWGGAWSRNM
jgi:hypothetical protein